MAEGVDNDENDITRDPDPIAITATNGVLDDDADDVIALLPPTHRYNKYCCNDNTHTCTHTIHSRVEAIRYSCCLYLAEHC